MTFNSFNFFGWFLSIVTTIGNGFVAFLVVKNRQLHSSANWFVLSLAVADFIVGLVVFPSGYFCYNTMACNKIAYMAVFWFAVHASVTNLCALTWDRYIAIVHPFKYNTSMTARRPGMVILIAWVIPLAISLSLLVGMVATSSNTVLKILRVTGVSAFDIMSCVLLFYAVVRILVVARAQSKQESSLKRQLRSNHRSNTEDGTPRRRNKHDTAAGFIIAIILFFLGCYVVVNYLVLCFTFSCHESEERGQVVSLLLIINSAVNPWVYAFLKKDIKSKIKKLIYRKKFGEQHSHSNTVL